MRCCNLLTHIQAFAGISTCSMSCNAQVRAAAVTLARALRGLTLRIADRAQSSEADAAAAVAVALPLLLEKGKTVVS